ncbi:MAG: site-specific DNA-methyltransferase [Phycisphaerales bacterium]|nr:site-specific DNA-methyltransferase [Phycisphaerales bacterium]
MTAPAKARVTAPAKARAKAPAKSAKAGGTPRRAKRPPAKHAELAAAPMPRAEGGVIAIAGEARGPAECRVHIGDSRALLRSVPECVRGEVDLIFADPPFNWKRDYDRWKAEHPGGTRDEYDTWNDRMPDGEYLDFTRRWLDGCIAALRPNGSLWVNIPDDWAAEIVLHLKGDRDADGHPRRRMHMVNWCIWHYRFGQNTLGRFINSKVHVLYFCKDASRRTWNGDAVLEPSDRATTYADKRTFNKKEGASGLRLPMDVWYGKYWGRIQGNNEERRAGHDNQIPEVYLERVIRACSNEGDLVLDPFLGSGTTCTVARELRRRSIGFEFSSANAHSAAQRIGAGPVRVRFDRPTQHISAIFSPRGSGKRAARPPADAE